MSAIKVCEYCGTERSCVWRKIVNTDDGTRREVWCCDIDYNYTEPEWLEWGYEPPEVLETTNGDDEVEIIDISDE